MLQRLDILLDILVLEFQAVGYIPKNNKLLFPKLQSKKLIVVGLKVRKSREQYMVYLILPKTNKNHYPESIESCSE